MASGKTIELLLRDGTFDGIVEASIGGHTIKGFKVGRDDSEIDAVAELANPGVYFLFCGGPADGVYIGESGNVEKRLKQHKRDYNSGKEKYFWTEALCFIEPSFTLVTKYCEDRLIEDAENTKNYVILTKASGAPKVSACIKVNMENFIENVETMVGTFGKTVFTKVAGSSTSSSTSSSSSASGTIYTYKGAKMSITKAGFTVLAGSVISSTVAPSLPKEILKLRNDLIAKGVIDSSFKLTKNQPFGSVSAAAKFVSGYSTKGTGDWKDPSGVPIGKKTI